MSDKHSRTERATPRKREKSREKGQVFRSREVSGALGFVAAVSCIAWGGPWLRDGLVHAMTYYFDASATTSTSVDELVTDALRRSSAIGLPFMAVALVAGVMGTVVQSPPVFTFEPMKPDPNRLFSLSKIKNIFSLSGVSNLVRGVLGLSALAAAGASVIAPEVASLSKLPHLAVPELAGWIVSLALRILVRAAVVFGVVAAIDFGLNHRRHEEQLKMTKQEVKEEHKQLEGDPQVKARIKKVQRAAANKRMMAMVAEATVVITNPTHIAVALRYSSDEIPAPKVVAKGKGELAERIRAEARKHGVVIYEDPPLARALYAVDLDAVIPSTLYKAVAEVLAHLVRISGLRL